MTVMAMAPLQTVGTMVLEYFVHGAVPGWEEVTGAAIVAGGLGLFVAGALCARSLAAHPRASDPQAAPLLSVQDRD